MWAKLDDKLPRHPKVLAAAKRLGKYGRARAGWGFVTVICYCAEYLTDGFFPLEALDQIPDPEPAEVLAALAGSGLLHEAIGGWHVHDFDHHNPQKAELEAKRARDRERKKAKAAAAAAAEASLRPQLPLPDVAESPRIPRGFHAESSRTPPTDSARNPERSRARDPVPSRPSDPDQEPCATAHQALVRLRDVRPHVRAAVHAALDRDPDAPDSELAAVAKDAAAACRALYDGRKITRIVDAVRAIRALRPRALRQRRAS